MDSVPIHQESGISAERYRYREPSETMIKSGVKPIVLLIKLHEFGKKLARHFPYTVLAF